MSGLDNTGFVEESITSLQTEIFNDLIALIGPQINTNPGSVLATIVGVFATRLQDVWDLAAAQYLSQYPDLSFGVQLDQAVTLNGISRLAATYSKITQQYFKGTSGTVVPAGTQLYVTGAPTSIFSLDQALTLGPGVNEVQTLTFSGVPASGTWQLSFNGQTTTSLAWNCAASDIQTALLALSTIGSGGCTVTGTPIGGSVVVTFAGNQSFIKQPILVVAADTLFTGGSVAVTITAAETTAGVPQAQGTLTCLTTGTVSAPAASLINFVNPIAGITSTTNPLSAVLGTNVETDAALKIRRRQQLSLAGASTISAMTAQLLLVTSVTSVIIFENAGDTVDGSGRPPHSFESFISGGADSDICKAIWTYKPAGVQSTGAIISSFTDSQGNSHVIKYSRPTQVNIYMIVTLTTNSLFPTGGHAQAVTNLLNYVNALGQGNSVVVSPGLVSSLSTITGIVGVSILIGTAPSPSSSSNITISSSQIAYAVAANISVTP